MSKETQVVQESEAKMKSSVEKSFNQAKKAQKESVNKAKTAEGKAEMMANIFGTAK